MICKQASQVKTVQQEITRVLLLSSFVRILSNIKWSHLEVSNNKLYVYSVVLILEILYNKILHIDLTKQNAYKCSYLLCFLMKQLIDI